MRALDKLTSILAAIDAPDTANAVLDKTLALARHFNAHVDLLLIGADCANRQAVHPGDRVRFIESTGERHSPQALLLRKAQELQPDLVIKASAGEHPLRRWQLGANDRLLAQECPAPLLLVGSRPWGAAMRMAACVDVTDVESTGFARATLQAAGFITVGCAGFLDILYSEREMSDERVRLERAVRVAQLVREFHMGSERLQIFNGAPANTLPRLIAERRYDVLAIGAVTHRIGSDNWTDSLSSKLADAGRGDLLLVKPPASHAGERRFSVREQRPHLAEQFL